jgi:hypothetical protein
MNAPLPLTELERPDLPHAVISEQALIGAMLVDPFACAEAVKRCDSALFYDPLLRRIFECLGEMQAAEERVTPLSVRARMGNDSALRELAVRPELREHKGNYLLLLSSLGSGFPEIGGYIEAMRKAARRRDALHIAGYSSEEKRDEGAAIEARAYVWTDPTQISPRDWVYSRHLIRRFCSATIAPGGAGKSSLLIAELVGLATGRPILGHAISRPHRVWYYNFEDPADEIARRVQAVCKHYGIGASEISDRLYVSSGRDQPFVMVRGDRDGAYVVQPVADKLVAEITDKKIDVFVADPFVSTHTIEENNNRAMDMAVKQWSQIADWGNAAVDLAHHTRKSGDAELNAESARGGSALVDACRSVRVINRMTKEEAERAGISNPRLYFRVLVDKLNLAPPPEKSDWYRLESIDLGNGALGPSDLVGVVTPWKWPDPFDGMSVKDLYAVQKRIAAGEWRESAQAKNWAGVAVAEHLNLDPRDKFAKARCRSLLKQWLGSGALLVVRKPDESRHERAFIEVGQWAVELPGCLCDTSIGCRKSGVAPAAAHTRLRHCGTCATCI